MNRYSKLGKNTMLLAIGNFSSKLLNYLLIPLYTFALTEDEYGIVDLLLTTITLLVPIITLSMSDAILRFTLDAGCEKKKIFSIGLLISALSCLILLGLLPVFWLFESLYDYLVLIYCLFLSRIFAEFFGQFVKGCDNVKIYTIAGVIQTIVALLGNIIFLLIFELRIFGYLFASMLSSLIYAIVLLVGCKLWSYITKIEKKDVKIIKEMLRYSLPLIPNNISWWINNFSDKYILAFYCGTGVVGLYATAYKIPSILQNLILIFSGAWQISAVEDFGGESSKEFYSNVYNSLSAILSIVCAIVIFCTEGIAQIAFQKGFLEAWRFAPLLVISFLFSGLSSFMGTIYTSAKETGKVFISTVMAAVCNIILNFLLIPKFNGYGAAIATIVSYFILWLYRILDTRRILKLDIDLKKNVLCYAVLVCMAFVATGFMSYCRYFLMVVGVLGILFFERGILIKSISFLKRKGHNLFYSR